jgi:hypothetical protein
MTNDNDYDATLRYDLYAAFLQARQDLAPPDGGSRELVNAAADCLLHAMVAYLRTMSAGIADDFIARIRFAIATAIDEHDLDKRHRHDRRRA